MPAICAITDCCELFIAHPLCGRLFSRERVSFSLRVSTTTDTKRLQRPLFFLSRSWTEILAYLRRHKSQGGTASAIHVGFGQHDVKLSLLPNLPVPEGAGTGSLCPRPTMSTVFISESSSCSHSLLLPPRTAIIQCKATFNTHLAKITLQTLPFSASGRSKMLNNGATLAVLSTLSLSRTCLRRHLPPTAPSHHSSLQRAIAGDAPFVQTHSSAGGNGAGTC